MVMATKSDPLASASSWLRVLRQTTCKEPEYASYLRADAANAGVTLEELGTSEDELDRLVRNAHANSARRWLGHLRETPDNGESYGGYVRDEVAKAGVTLADIGTSEDELGQLERTVHEKRARYWLERLRNPSEQLKRDLPWFIRNHATKAGMTVEQLGTSEDELKRLSDAT